MNMADVVSPVDLGITAGLIGILAWAIKRWLNGTVEKIKDLEVNKVSVTFCTETREGCAKVQTAKVALFEEQVKTLRHDWEQSLKERNDAFREIRDDIKRMLSVRSGGV